MARARTKARELATQALYQWLMAGQDLIDIEKQFLVEPGMKGVDYQYFRELLFKIPKTMSDLDASYDEFLDRPVSQLDPVEHAILSIASHEMAGHPETPYKVVINEAVELAKVFGATESHKYINGVLDKLARKARPLETRSRGAV